MAADGSNKTPLPAGVSGIPGYALHQGRRWFATPGGVLVRDDGARSVALTPSAVTFPSSEVAWGRDDSFVSFGAWDSISTSAPHRIYRVPVAYDTAGSPYPIGLPVEVLMQPPDPYGIRRLGGHSWAPDESASRGRARPRTRATTGSASRASRPATRSSSRRRGA
jgi:hypothetical protein